MDELNQQTAMLAALQLASPALPIGGFSYSQGLEAAVDVGAVGSAPQAQAWCVDALHVFMQCDAVVFAVQYAHWEALNTQALQTQNDWFFATRETSELRLETQQMGWSMVKLISQNGWGSEPLRAALNALQTPTLTTAFAAACTALAIPLPQAMAAYAFSWAENQVAAAVKSVPLGQQAGQTVLNALRAAMPPLLAQAQRNAAQTPPKINTFSPHLALLSSKHETQYSRLFRS
jgi:urease accessory protein